ncbi:S1 family peptidase [Rhizocola hellebori]|uniref:S1 family peptidase n=1 Tax=Rhizocola hellebori TaxID=1392758 RepID=UPI001942F668|nr:trypsin-like serine protease [Rhizocola hellebori]
MRTSPIARLAIVASLFASSLAAPAAPAIAYSGPTGDGDVGTTVVGGVSATENYSFMVYVSGCTGSLIKANWVVTAKHCSNPSSVRVGSINRTSGGVVVSVVQVVNNPSADVKLFRLASNVTFAPAPIPTTSGAVGTATRIIGWGQTCPTPGCGSAPTVARQLDTSIRTDGSCSGINGPLEICTNNTGGVAGACYGDSGGPQVKKIAGSTRWWLIGATSRAGNNSSTCATGPSIYSDLTAIRSWINTTVGGLPA